jgi:hypothetical protein
MAWFRAPNRRLCATPPKRYLPSTFVEHFDLLLDHPSKLGIVGRIEQLFGHEVGNEEFFMLKLVCIPPSATPFHSSHQKLYSKQSQDPLTRKIRVGFDPEKPSVYYPVAAVRTWENVRPPTRVIF